MCDETGNEGLDRRRIGGIMDLEHRALHDVGALFGEQAGKLRLLARFQDQDAVTVQSLGHGMSLQLSKILSENRCIPFRIILLKPRLNDDRPSFVHPDS